MILNSFRRCLIYYCIGGLLYVESVPSTTDEIVITEGELALQNNSIAENQSADNDSIVESYFSITCCRGGEPIADKSISKYVKNFKSEFAGQIFADHQQNITCDRFNGKYSVPLKATTNDKDFSSGVRCRCKDEHLDRNCRQQMAECQNGGYRAFSINLRCVCPGLYFGDLCEKYCLNGQLERNELQIVDRCACRPKFYGNQCENIVCFNGGTPVNGRGCSCPPFIFGQHCETRLNDRPMDLAAFGEWPRSDGSVIGPYVPQFHESRKQIWDATGAGASVILLALVFGFIVYYYAGQRRRRRRLAASTEVNGIHGEANTPYSVDRHVEMLAPLPTYEQAIKATVVLNVPNLAQNDSERLQRGNQPVADRPPDQNANGPPSILPV